MFPYDLCDDSIQSQRLLAINDDMETNITKPLSIIKGKMIEDEPYLHGEILRNGMRL